MVEAKDENQLPAAAFTTGGDDGTSIRTLMLTDIVDSTVLLDRVGDARAAEIFGRHDVVFRELLQAHEGREIDKTDGFLLLFRRPFEAVRYAVAYQDALIELSEELGFELKARAGIHLGEVVLRENPPAHVARGAKPVEVEGLAKHAAARIMSLARGGQILLSESAYTFARRGAVGADAGHIQWQSHGLYSLKGVEEPVQVYEVGREGVAPFSAPGDSEKVRRIEDQAPKNHNSWLLFALTIGVLGLALSQLLTLTEAPVQPDAAAPPVRSVADVSVPTATPQPTPALLPAPPAEMTLTITSAPGGAEIILGGVSRGNSPAVLRIPAEVGKHVGRARLEGHVNQRFECVVLSSDVEKGDAKCEVILDAVPPPPAPKAPSATETPTPKKASKKPAPKPVGGSTPAPKKKPRYKIHTLE